MKAIPTISLAKACLISLTAAACLPAAAARPSFDNETTSALSEHHDWRPSVFILVEEPVPAQIGMPPQFNVRMSNWQLLRKRDCLENGSNFCFANNPRRSCPDCGECCTSDSDQWCCAKGSTCGSSVNDCCAGEPCGDGLCCTGSQTCNNGKCESPVVTTTTTTTIHTTLTHTEVEMVTVQNLVIETSTINSIVTTTVTSNDGTQTEVTYSTTTVQANAKRTRGSEPTPGPLNLRRDKESNLARRAGRKLWRNLVYGGEQEPFDPSRTRISPTQPRQCMATTTADHLVKRQGDGTSTSTVTKTEMITDHTTINDKRTTTVQSTSVSRTTIFQTSTKVIGAKATVSTTSIITITARKASTQTITSTSTFLIDPTGLPADDGTGGDTDDPSLNDPSNITKKKKKGLSSSAVAGIGVGAGLVSLTSLILGFFFWRRHKKNKTPRAYDFTYSPAPQMTSPGQTSPRRAPLPFGGAGVVPSHHDTSYTPTVSEMHTDQTPDSYNKTSGIGPTVGVAAAGAGVAAGAAATRQGHTRNSSSVSQPFMPSGQTSPDPYSDPYRESGQGWSTNANELPTEQRYELGDEDAAPAPLRTQQQAPPPVPPPRNQYRTGPHPSTSSISRVTRFAELDGSR